MDTAAPVHIPLSERINFRMITFAALLLVLVGLPTYWYLDATISGGVKDVGGGYKQVDLKAMSNFIFDQQNGTIEDVPEKWRALDGQKVILYGEMWQPNVAANRISDFELVYSIAKCCFSGPPQVQHFVKANVIEGKQVGFYDGLVKVTGTLHVNVKKAQGKVERVYELDVEDVTPA